jgi:hypothetical protein
MYLNKHSQTTTNFNLKNNHFSENQLFALPTSVRSKKRALIV